MMHTTIDIFPQSLSWQISLSPYSAHKSNETLDGGISVWLDSTGLWRSVSYGFSYNCVHSIPHPGAGNIRLFAVSPPICHLSTILTQVTTICHQLLPRTILLATLLACSFLLDLAQRFCLFQIFTNTFLRGFQQQCCHKCQVCFFVVSVLTILFSHCVVNSSLVNNSMSDSSPGGNSSTSRSKPWLTSFCLGFCSRMGGALWEHWGSCIWLRIGFWARRVTDKDSLMFVLAFHPL